MLSKRIMVAASPTPAPKPRPLALAMVLYLVLYTVFAVVTARAPESEARGPIFLAAMTGSAVAIFLIWCFSDRKTDDRSLRDLIFAGMVVDILPNYFATRATGALFTALTGLGNLGVLAAAIGVGLFVGRGLKKPNYLVLAAFVGAVTDIYSVYFGPSKHVHISDLFNYLSFQWGLIGQRSVLPIVGAGDFIFLTLFFFGSRKFGLDDRKTLAAMIVAIGAGFVVTLFVGVVPALPFMSSALLLTHGRELLRQMKESGEAAQI